MSDKSLVVQHNAIIEARYKLSVGEQRLIKTLASMINREDAEFKPYTVRIADFAALVGVERKDYYEAVRRTAENLMSQPFTLIEGDESITMNWFSSVRYKPKTGVVELRFDPSLKPYLLLLKERFTKYELGNILRLKKRYSIRIYELCKQYQVAGRRRFTIDELRDILCLKDEYKLYGDIKRRVLLDSQKELAAKTDIAFDFEEIKDGKKVIAVEITIRGNSVKEGKKKQQKKPENRQVESLVSLGVARSTAEELAAEYDVERIDHAVAYTQTQIHEGKLNNPAGFVVEAVKNGYRDSRTEERQRKEEAARLEAAKEAGRREWEKMKERWNAWKAERVKEHIAALDAEALEREKAAFLASMADNFAMMKLVKKSRENEERHFRIHITGKLDGLGMSEWAREVGVDLSPFAELGFE